MLFNSEVLEFFSHKTPRLASRKEANATMKNGHCEGHITNSSSAPMTQPPVVEDASDDEEDVSIINPFASAPRSVGTVRHRGSNYSSVPSNSNTNTSSFGDWQISSATPLQQSASQRPLPPTRQPLHLGLGTAGFLEIEEELPLSSERVETQDLLGLDPVRTNSGLLLTHRQTTAMPRSKPAAERTHGTFINGPSAQVNLSHGSEALEMELGYAGANGFGSPQYSKSAGQSMALVQTRHFLSYVKLWNAAFCIFLIIGTGVIIHSVRHERSSSVKVTESKTTASLLTQSGSVKVSESETTASLFDSSSRQEQATSKAATSSEITEQIILLPLPNATHRRMVAQPEAPLQRPERDIRQSIHALRHEFEEWVQKHNRVYHSQEEKEYRFQVWHDNHHRTIEKNQRHGPCKMTGEPVFGSNHFKDLTTEEFKAKYLTGYKGPHTDQLKKPLTRGNRNNDEESQKHRRVVREGLGFVPGPKERAQAKKSAMWHPTVQERYLKAWETKSNPYQSSSSCSFYDVSCWLRWFMYTYGYGIGGTMEPKYDSDTFPEAIDWRDYGAVSEVHSQGNCGACWAITAVETIESVYALKMGTLVELSETEVIVCDDSCEMCNGGWPQNAYDFAMDKGGLLPENSLSYDGDFLYKLTSAREGQSDTYE